MLVIDFEFKPYDFADIYINTLTFKYILLIYGFNY